MSDLGFRFTPHPTSQIERLPQPAGFRADARFGPPGTAVVAEPEAPEEELPDPVAEGYSRGFEAGYHQAMSAARAKAEADADAAQKLGLAFARLDAALEEELRLRLRDTVAALCEAAIAPLAIDEAALLRRVKAAAGMLARADDERVIRLHPDDMELICAQLPEDWVVEPDASLERGTIRVEAANGGVEDGPATWRHAIGEALHQC